MSGSPFTKVLNQQCCKKILEATNARKDETILCRIEGEDLIAMDIEYHKTCYASFTSKDHIQRAMTPKYNLEFDPYKIAIADT